MSYGGTGIEGISGISSVNRTCRPGRACTVHVGLDGTPLSMVVSRLAETMEGIHRATRSVRVRLNLCRMGGVWVGCFINKSDMPYHEWRRHVGLG